MSTGSRTDDNLIEFVNGNKMMCFGKLHVKTQEVVLEEKDADVDDVMSLNKIDLGNVRRKKHYF